MTARRRARKKRASRRARRLAAIALGLVAMGVAGFLAGVWTTSPPGAGPYMPHVSRWCAAYNVNPDLAAAVLEAESSGRPRAVSSAGALGLMQLMPATAAEVAQQLSLGPPSREDLFDPERNVRFGVYYLSRLRRRFGDEREFVIAAYHAGPTRVDSWRRARADMSATEVVAELAPVQTRKYVRRVLFLWKRNASRRARKAKLGILVKKRPQDGGGGA